MSHVTHHHLGDSGTTHSHHHHELSVSHHTSSTFHALHHEATASLSSPHHASSVHLDKTSLAKPASVKAAESVHLSTKSTNTAKAESTVHLAGAKPAKAESNVHLAASKPDKAESGAKPAKAESNTHLAATKPDKAESTSQLAKLPKLDSSANLAATGTERLAHNSLDLSSAIPRLSIINDLPAKTAKATPDLSSLVPAHLTETRPVVQRTAAGADAGTGLFAAAKASEQLQPGDTQKAASLPQFDAKKPISEMTYTGAIVDRTSQVLAPTDKAKLAAGEVPSIQLSLQNPADQNTKPDFLIHKDGRVEMFSNPQTTGQKDIVVQFERNGDQTSLTDAQKNVGGNFYSYLAAQLKSQFPQVAPEAFKVNDSQGLLRDSQLPAEVKKNIEQQQHKADIPPSSGLPEHAGPTMQDTRRISQGGRSSSIPRSDVQDMTPPVKQIPNEAERVQAMKDTLASYVTRGEKHPYDYVAHRGSEGWGVGRYGLTYKQVGNFLSGLTDEQIDELIKQGKLSPQQAAGLKKMRDSIKHAQETGNDQDLDPFLKAMKNGEGTEEDMRKGVQQFLPDKVQELAASDQIAKISGDLSRDAMQKGQPGAANPGQVALSFVLGRTVNKEEYESNPEYKNFVDSANQAYRLQEQSRLQGGPIINVENMSQVGDALNKMVGQQFWREAAGATEYGNKGCAIAVTRMLQHMGVQIGTHLDVTGTAQDMRSRGWQEVSLAQAMRSGQLFVAVNKETGSHVGLGMGNQVWENSSGQRQVVTRNMSGSTLRNSGRAFIVPIQAASNKSPSSAA